MRAITAQQIILLLAFILAIVINLVTRWIQRRARERHRPRSSEPAAAASPAREEWPPTTLPPRARAIEPAHRIETPARPEPPETPPARATPPVLRRVSPLGGRAAVRRAIVAMAILGPCPGLQPPPDDRGGGPAARDGSPLPVPRPEPEDSGPRR